MNMANILAKIADNELNNKKVTNFVNWGKLRKNSIYIKYLKYFNEKSKPLNLIDVSNEDNEKPGNSKFDKCMISLYKAGLIELTDGYNHIYDVYGYYKISELGKDFLTLYVKH